MADIRGLILLSRLDYVERHIDGAAFKSAAEALPEAARQVLLDQVFMVNDYPFEWLRALDGVLTTASELDETALFEAVGRQFAAMLLDRYFFNYIETRQPGRYLAQLQRHYPRLWGFGRMEFHSHSRGEGTIDLVYPEPVHAAHTIFMATFLKEGMVICGASDIVLEPSDSSGEHRHYVVRWTDAGDGLH